ncbi:hypothetical protein [Ferrimonas balearica]|uniref:hypothetical protein n=1 Tax=Ferrimonas balearica TaxID=44012 RepID=UPI001F2A4FC3|nr:hypothetical protein [Ferrimonas balearica]MBY6093826.1 hypothetical protein [Ferrimonas balearica]
MSENYFPKGGMCKSCVHRLIDCSHLDFSQMRVIQKDGNDHYVQCVGYARLTFSHAMRDPKMREAVVTEAFDKAMQDQQEVIADAAKELNDEADAILDALENTIVRVKVDEIPQDPLEAVNYGIDLFDQALKNYANDLRRGDVFQ